MKVLGTDNQIEPYAPEDERPHPFGGDPNWQESVVILWYDAKLGVGGYQRIGHEPYHNNGEALLWSFVFTPDEHLRTNLKIPFRDDFRSANSFRVDDVCKMTHTDHVQWTIDDVDCRVRIAAEDYFPHTDVWPKDSASLSSQAAPNHSECAGRVFGKAELRGATYDIDGLCYRDHSWGRRNWSIYGHHIWIAGTCGPELSFALIDFTGSDGNTHKEATFIYRDHIRVTKDFDVEIARAPDGISCTTTKMTFRFPDGMVLEGQAEIIDSVATHPHGYLCIDNMCTIRLGDHNGFCDVEYGWINDGAPLPDEFDPKRKKNGWAPRQVR